MKNGSFELYPAHHIRESIEQGRTTILENIQKKFFSGLQVASKFPDDFAEYSRMQLNNLYQAATDISQRNGYIHSFPVHNTILILTSQKEAKNAIPKDVISKYRGFAAYISGYIEILKNEYESGIVFFKEAEVQFEHIMLTNEAASARASAAFAYYSLGQFENSHELILPLINSNNINDEYLKLQIMQLSALIYIRLGKIKEATYILEKSTSQCFPVKGVLDSPQIPKETPRPLSNAGLGSRPGSGQNPRLKKLRRSSSKSSYSAELNELAKSIFKLTALCK